MSENEIDSFGPHLTDERTKILIQTTTCMPFDVYVVPATDVYQWCDYVKMHSKLHVFNCVYLLFGHDFIYAGKSVNGDRILGHIEDETKSDFDFQMLFVPNNDNPYTMTNWTSDFMAYLESLMIDRLKENNPFCKNQIAGKNIKKNQRDLNLNADKEEFADNVVELIFDAFCDLTYCTYLVPQTKSADYGENGMSPEAGTKDNEGMMDLWKDILMLSRLNHPDSKFHQLMKPQKGNVLYRNMNADKLITDSSINCVITQSTCRVEFAGWGNTNSAETNLRNFDCLRQHKEEIEAEFGCSLNWDRKDNRFTTSISLSKSLRYTDQSNGTHRDMADFFSVYFDKFYTILPKYCPFNPNGAECNKMVDVDR